MTRPRSRHRHGGIALSNMILMEKLMRVAAHMNEGGRQAEEGAV